MDIVTLGAALNGSAEHLKSHFKNGANIQIVDNPDGTQTINASGEISSEDTVAREAIANLSDETQAALDNKVDKVEGKDLSTNDFTNSYKAKVDNSVAVSLSGEILTFSAT